NINLKRGADANFTFDLDPALMLFHDAIDGGEAESCAFADFFGGKERFKNPVHRFAVHAATCVGHAQSHGGTHARIGVLLSIGGIDVHGGGGDEELAAFGHGIPGVDGEIHDDLLQHSGIRLQRGKR